MMQAHSSTSSSDGSCPRTPRSRRAQALWFVLGITAVLILFEFTVSTLFSMDPSEQEPHGSLERYFSYGYSTEAKLNRSVGDASQEPTAIINAGWIPTELYPPPENWETANHRITFYGMSFTNRAARALKSINPELAISSRAGPAAPFNHSYALFEADPWADEPDVIVVGILSSSLAYTHSISGLGYTPESPAPYSFPKFELIDNKLVRHDPIITQRDQFIEAFRTRSKLWYQYKDQLAQLDGYWDPFVFNHSLLDRSAFIRLVRRAWASKVIDSNRTKVYSPRDGYNTRDPALAAVPYLLNKMHQTCAKNNQRLIVLLLHARGEPGHLDQWLAPILRSQEITVISTTDLFSSTDPLNFESDSHYRPDLDQRIAQTINEIIETQP